MRKYQQSEMMKEMICIHTIQWTNQYYTKHYASIVALQLRPLKILWDTAFSSQSKIGIFFQHHFLVLRATSSPLFLLHIPGLLVLLELEKADDSGRRCLAFTSLFLESIGVFNRTVRRYFIDSVSLERFVSLLMVAMEKWSKLVLIR